MDKIKYVKLEQPDGSYSDSIPLAVDSDYVDVNGNTLTNVLGNKADNTDINNLQIEINSLASGSPLVASSVSEMTDTSRVYVNTTDGYWYTYDGSSWVARGKYQAAEDSNTIENLNDFVHDFLFKDQNLINKKTVTEGIRINVNTGEIVEHGNYATSDYFEVSKFYNYYIACSKSGSSLIYFDENYNYISGVENILYSNNRRVPNNPSIKYCRCSFEKQYVDTISLIVSSSQITSAVEDNLLYGKYLKEDVNVKFKATNFGFFTRINSDGELQTENTELYVGEEVTNAGQKNQAIKFGNGASSNTQSANIAIGVDALKNNQESSLNNDNGKYMVAIGHQSLKDNTTGDHNTAVGWGSATNNTTGSGNTAVGEDALCHNSTGNNNTCIGNRAYQNGTGNNNTILGQQSCYSSSNNVDNIPTGNGNTAVGYATRPTGGNGNYNTAIGIAAGPLNDLNNTTAIGTSATPRKSRQVVIGSTNQGSLHPEETILNGYIIVCGNDYIFRKLIFNQDGSVSWQDVSNDYQNYL